MGGEKVTRSVGKRRESEGLERKQRLEVCKKCRKRSEREGLETKCVEISRDKCSEVEISREKRSEVEISS